MAATVNYNKPVFAASPLLITAQHNLAAVTDFATIPVSATALYTCAIVEGGIVERITATCMTNIGSTNSAMHIYIFIVDGIGVGYLYATKSVAATTVSSTTPPASVQFTFAGGMLIPNGSKVSIGTSASAGSFDYLNVVLEGGEFQTI